jgi:ComEC/Rec2-related protein
MLELAIFTYLVTNLCIYHFENVIVLAWVFFFAGLVSLWRYSPKVFLIMVLAAWWADLHNVQNPPPKQNEPRTVSSYVGSAPSKAEVLELQLRLNLYPQPISGWLEATVFGDKTRLDREITFNFSSLGIFHLIVVSGMHVTLAAGLITAILALIFRIPYIFKLVKSTYFIFWSELALWLGFAAALAYVRLIGFVPSAQRAILVAVAALVLRASGANYAPFHIVTFALGAQIILFPKNLLSLSFILSWSAYIIVIDLYYQLGRARSLLVKFNLLLRAQCELFVISLAFIPQLSIGSILINLLMIPIFTPIFVVGVVLTLAHGHVNPQNSWLGYGEKIQTVFIDSVATIADWHNTVLNGYLQVNCLATQIGFLILAIFLLLQRVSNLRRIEEPKSGETNDTLTGEEQQ